MALWIQSHVICPSDTTLKLRMSTTELSVGKGRCKASCLKADGSHHNAHARPAHDREAHSMAHLRDRKPILLPSLTTRKTASAGK